MIHLNLISFFSFHVLFFSDLCTYLSSSIFPHVSLSSCLSSSLLSFLLVSSLLSSLLFSSLLLVSFLLSSPCPLSLSLSSSLSLSCCLSTLHLPRAMLSGYEGASRLRGRYSSSPRPAAHALVKSEQRDDPSAQGHK